MKRRWTLPIVIVAMVAAACGAGSDAGGEVPPPSEPTVTTISVPPPSPPPSATTTTLPAPSTPPTTTPTTTTTPPAPPAPAAGWSPPTLLGDGPGAAQSDVVAGPGGLVGVEFAPTDLDAFTRLLRSTDGREWTEAAYLDGVRLFEVVAGGPGYVAVGERQVAGSEEIGSFEVVPAIYVSSDGRGWAEASITAAAASAAGFRAQPLGLARPGGAIAVPATADGPSVSGGSVRAVAATAAGLIAVGRSPLGHPAVWSSADGRAWTERPGNPFGRADAGVVAVAAGAPGLVALGAGPTRGDYPGPVIVWWSADGADWSEVATLVADDFGQGPLVAGVVPFGDGFVLAGSRLGEGPAAWTSPDGRDWGGPAPLPGSSQFSLVLDLATDGAGLVAVGADDGATAWTSTDGVAWRQQAITGILDAAEPRRAVAHGSRWLAFGMAWSYEDEEARRVLWELEGTGPSLVDVELHFLTDGAQDCDDVTLASRQVAGPGVLRGALEALLAGPTAAERAGGVVSTFSAETAGMLISVTIEDGVALVDFRDFSRIVPNASTSCGSLALYAQLDGTVTQFPTVDRAVYFFDGEAAPFYEWLQGSPPPGY